MLVGVRQLPFKNSETGFRHDQEMARKKGTVLPESVVGGLRSKGQASMSPNPATLLRISRPCCSENC